MIYEFDEFSINTAKRELRRGSDPVKLEPRSYELLAYFVEHRDRAIGKDELQDKIWGTIVSDSAMTRSVMKLRQSLGDSEGSIIETVRGFGYRFVADVKSPEEVAPAAPSSHAAPAVAAKEPAQRKPLMLAVAALTHLCIEDEFEQS